MDETGDPATLAPEVCVEIVSASNTEGELAQKRTLYRELGAEEVWIVGEEGQIRFFGDSEREASQIAPDCPDEVQIR